tara:strand:- start:337 stop:855 length:519 start_codon:yes stop_codon:yes gene_type:complete
MTVSYNSQLTSSNVNNAFASKSANNTLSGVLDLNESSSGDRVTNVQQKLNDLQTSLDNFQVSNAWTTVATEDISASGTITTTGTDNIQYRRVQGSGGAVTASNLPFGSSITWNDGLVVRLVCVSDVNTVSFTSNDSQYGMILNGDATLSKYNTLTVQYDSTLERFIEVGRNF